MNGPHHQGGTPALILRKLGTFLDLAVTNLRSNSWSMTIHIEYFPLIIQ